MRIRLNDANPPRRSARNERVQRYLAAAITAAGAVAAFALGRAGDRAHPLQGGLAALALYLVVAALLWNQRASTRAATLEIENGRAFLCSRAGFVRRKEPVDLGAIRALTPERGDYIKGHFVPYIRAEDARGNAVFRILDCEENRRVMEGLTGLSCDFEREGKR